jgi:hypothetical protein
MEIENSLASAADDMDMGRSVVVGVNDHAQAVYPITHRRHYSTNPSVLVLFLRKK